MNLSVKSSSTDVRAAGVGNRAADFRIHFLESSEEVCQISLDYAGTANGMRENVLSSSSPTRDVREGAISTPARTAGFPFSPWCRFTPPRGSIPGADRG